jgi:hypothetical protein
LFDPDHLLDRPVAGLASQPGADVAGVAEEREVRQAVDLLPGRRPVVVNFTWLWQFKQTDVGGTPAWRLRSAPAWQYWQSSS